MKISENLTPAQSRLLEQTDANAWAWMYQQFPADYQQQLGFGIENVGNIHLLYCQKIPFRHFNTPQNLGIAEAMTSQQLDEVLAVFDKLGIRNFYIHTTPFCEPADFLQQLTDKGMRYLSHWERIWRDDKPLAAHTTPPENCTVEEVTTQTAQEWADFVDATYRMTTKPWLLNLIDKEGFHAYVFRRNGKIVVTRTMIIRNQYAWSGMDAPVPGVMAPTFEEDFFVAQQMVQDGLSWGVKLFSTDIEKPYPSRDTPAYQYWGKLGFEIAYLRDNYGF
ncbi:MAG: hypothetical protein U0Y10_00655 [Spirosomataceae bacterium]